jgi:TonB family protein
MKQFYAFTLLLIVAFNMASGQDLQISFKLNEYALSDSAKILLESKLSTFLQSDSVVIVGHTDSTGTEKYNLELSKMRTQSVSEILKLNGIKSEKVKSYWVGEEFAGFNSDATNRRADVFIHHSEKEYRKIDNQVFALDNSRDTTFYGKLGTQIILPAGSIIPDDTTKRRVFQLVLEEYYLLSDILFNELTTRTSSQILETGGMINLNIFQDGTECTINPKKPIRVGFPNLGNSQDEMSLFYGNPNHEGEIIWEEASRMDEISNSFFTLVEEMPQFPGGDSKRFNFFSQNLQYPLLAVENGIEGTVYVSFVVRTDGEITDVKVLRGIGGGCDEEALRVISTMPRWIPGKQNGKNVDVLFNLPICFRLTGEGLIAGFDFNCRGNYQPITDSMFRKTTVNAVNSYIFNVLSLGWLNCDRYIYKNEPSVTMNARLGVTEEVSVFLIFTVYKSVLKGTSINGFYSFKQIPKNKNAVLVAMKKMGEKCFFAYRNIKTRNGTETLDNFEEISFSDLETWLEAIKKEF